MKVVSKEITGFNDMLVVKGKVKGTVSDGLKCSVEINGRTRKTLTNDTRETEYLGNTELRMLGTQLHGTFENDARSIDTEF